MNRRFLAARALMIGGMLAVAGCSQPNVVDRGELESSVKTKLETAVGAKARGVSCPDELNVEAKAKTRCTLEAMDGTKFGVTVTVTSVKGDDAELDYQVDQSPTR